MDDAQDQTGGDDPTTTPHPRAARDAGYARQPATVGPHDRPLLGRRDDGSLGAPFPDDEPDHGSTWDLLAVAPDESLPRLVKCGRNALRGLGGLRMGLPALLALAHEVGAGDLWLGYELIKSVTSPSNTAGLPPWPENVRDEAALIRHRLGLGKRLVTTS